MCVNTTRRFVTALCVFALCATGATTASDKKKPSVTLRANPLTGMAPLKVVLTASIVGGPNDYEDFYCPTIEWEWGDETKSESKVDCDPYEAGKSEIIRSYTVEHRFNIGGDHRVQFRVRKNKKTVGAASVVIRVTGMFDRDGRQ